MKKTDQVFEIFGEEIKAGEQKQVNLEIAKLPSRTPISIPIFISRSKNAGPCLLVTAGMHGDETNGIEIVRQVMREKYHIPEKGTTICIPILNIYGFIQQVRDLPDGKDMNRSFPGSKTGSLASRVAYTVMNEILPYVDYGLDFHTGGAARSNYPQIRCFFEHKETIEMSRAFYAPFTLNSSYRSASFRWAAAKKKIPVLVYEGGESLRLDAYGIQCGVNGFRRLMGYLGMAAKQEIPQRKNIILEKSTWIRARSSGIFRAHIQSGAEIKAGQILGSIHSPYSDFEKKVKSTHNGYVIALNHQAVINQGDALLHIGFSK